MTEIHPDLLTVLDAVEVLSPTRFALRGEVREIPATGQNGKTTVSTEAENLPLRSAIADTLYGYLYTRPTLPYARPPFDPLARRDLTAALSAANTGRGTWDAGWVVLHLDEEGQIAVTKDDLIFWAKPAGLRVHDGEVRPGAACRVKVGKELRNRMAGYYFAIGNGEEDDEAGSLARYYWHLTRAAAVPFMAAATRLLNEGEVPFRLKVFCDPDAYRRADAGVLYVGRQYYQPLGDIIARIHGTIASVLRPAVPLFTKRLADGLGFAEYPGGALSFGQHRCELAATALWESFLRGESDRNARVIRLAEVFRAQGLDPMRPYLTPGSDHATLWPALVDEGPEALPILGGARPLGASPSDRTGVFQVSPLAAAVRIGQTLCQEAVWDLDGRLCNWMGRSSSAEGQNVPTSSALGPALYDGSAGVALYLGQLYAMTGDPECRRVALGAINRSIRHLDRKPTRSVSPISFFLGHLGAAYVADRLSRLTGHRELEAQVDTLLDHVAGAVSEPHVFDVIGGSAGAIPAFLAMGRDSARFRCRELAVVLGDDLVRAAVRQGTAWVWDAGASTGPGSGSALWTGFAHGAAGIGLALLELHAATGRLDFLEAARGAFGYEDSLFDPLRRNWPDLRPSARLEVVDSPPQFASAWCHGAPGIALSRLRALTCDQARGEAYLASTRAAIDTTLDAIEERLETFKPDATLCHGLAGLVEIVLIAGQVLGDETYLRRASAVGRTLIDRHAAAGDWTSGLPCGGPNPSLMLGTAGIGYTLLRLHKSDEVPPIIIIIP
jgi:Lanthionine synthetase C-like protein/HopA1 effector protein family